MLVVATGVFEILHPGHILYLEQSKALGDRLVVVVARDSTAQKRKRRPVISSKQRLHMVASLKPVDDAVLGDEVDMFKTIELLKPDILTIGPDQDFKVDEISVELLKRGLSTKVVKIEKYWDVGLHSSKIIVDLIKNNHEN